MLRYLINYALIVFLSLSIIYAQDTGMDKVKEIYLKAKEEFAPDKRTSIFNIDVELSNNIIVLKGETNIKKAKNFILGELNKLKIEYKDEIALLPSQMLGTKKYGVINLSVANLRVNPDHAAEMATQSLLGTAVKVFNKKNGWYQIQTPDGYIGWVDQDGVYLMDINEVNKWISSPKVIYTNEFSFVYSKADKKSRRVSDIVLGSLLKFLGEENGFIKVEYPNGRIGYIEKENCKDFKLWLEETIPTEESIIETAARFIGMPYLWGGTSAKAMDCSGFSKTVYYMNGILLQRDASQQVLTGELVDTQNGFENCRPGDLLFFGNKATNDKPERITHVAIYLGNLEFIHSAGEISIDSFDKNKPNFNEYRLKQFIRAKRVLNSLDKNGIYTLKNFEQYKGELFNEDE
jgi:SH3-like domain-containing protein